MINDNPLVTVIVASYNHHEFLVERMESLLKQDYSNIEIIVIDDASTDKSVEVLSQYEIYPQVTLISLKRNIGWVAVSNLGAELALGEYVVFANCDDFANTSQIGELVNSLNSNPLAGMSFTRSYIVNEFGAILSDDFSGRGRKFKKKCIRDCLLSSKTMQDFLFHSIVIPNLSAAMFRRSIFLDVGKFSEKIQIAVDWEMYFRISKKHQVAYISKPLNYFRSHSQSIRSNTRVQAMQRDITSLLLNEIRNSKVSVLRKLKYRHRVMYLLILTIRSLRRSDFVDFYYLVVNACRIDVICCLVFPVAFASRLARVPVGLLIRGRMILKDSFKQHSRRYSDYTRVN